MTFRRSLTAVATLATAAVVTLFAGTARASFLPDCSPGGGGLDISSTASCTVTPPGVSCEAGCTPISFTAACSAQGEASCMGGCTGGIDVSCNTSCEASCMGSCSASGGFDCQGSCEASAMANCSAACSSGENDAGEDMTTCMAQCSASISARCNVSCTAVPPTISCMGGCQAACSGSCTASSNLSCDISCQAKLNVMCTSSLMGSCMVNCQGTTGSLSCDGQFVDVNQAELQKCEQEIEQLLPQVTVSGDVSVMSGCDGGDCEISGKADAKGTITCAVSQPGYAPTGAPLAGLGLGIAVLAVARRRKREDNQ